MTVRYLKTYASLDGHITVEDAEELSNWLKVQARPAVKLGKAEHLHSAVLQVLLALRPKVLTPPREPWLAAALDRP